MSDDPYHAQPGEGYGFIKDYIVGKKIVGIVPRREDVGGEELYKLAILLDDGFALEVHIRGTVTHAALNIGIYDRSQPGE